MSKLSWQCIEGDCERPREGNTERCSSHNAVARKDLRDLKKQKEKRFVPISKMSQTRAAEMAEYVPLREQYLKDNPECAFKFEGCSKKATTIHHRSMSADDFLIVATWLGGCLHCHTVCENMPADVRREKLFLIEPTKKETI